MAKYISILRGINVGGKRKILMADLRALYEKLGHSNIVTYIQSGNVIFDSDKKAGADKIAKEITSAINEKYGFDVPVIVRSVEYLENTKSGNPFIKNGETDIERLCVTFLSGVPEKGNLEKLMTYDYSPDKFEVIGDKVFIYCAGKYHQSKFTNNFFEKKLKVSATTRNWKTVMKLCEMSLGE